MSLVKRMLESRRSVGGARKKDLPFELSLDSFSSDQKAIRTEDEELTKRYNAEVSKWTRKRRVDLRRGVSQKVKRNVSLAESIRGRVYHHRRGVREAQSIGFSFLREGIYLHKGAGRGQGGLIGGSWIDPHGRKKTRDPRSAGKMGTGNRKEVDWFDAEIEKTMPQLADIVTDYSATLQINATNIYIER